MNCPRLFLFALVLACCAPIRAAAEIGRTTVNGRAYLRVRDWVQKYHLEPAWIQREKTMQLTGGTTRIVLEMDSHQITFNGLNISLSHPVVYRNEAAWLSQLDATTALAPLLDPPRNPAGKKIKTICLDAGHGGRDPGYVVSSKQEKKYTLLLAQEVRDLLTKQGFKVVLTRWRDTFPELSDRVATANRSKADLFVSLHFNAFPPDKSVNGAETYCLTPAGASSSNAAGAGAGSGASRGNANNDENVWLAYQMQKSLTRTAGSKDRGVKRARFQVLRDTTMPAALIETGFMSNAVEGKKISDSKSRKAYARAVVEGIVAYKKSVERGN